MKLSDSKFFWALVVISVLLASNLAIAGDAPGFCPGVTPPAPDSLEPNNTLETATLYTPSTLPVVLNFDSDDDEDWLIFRAFDFATFGNVYVLDFGRPTIGTGTLMENVDPDPTLPIEGPGIFLRVFRIERAGLVEVNQFGDGPLDPQDQRCLFDSPTLDFTFAQVADYAVQISQCRNAEIDINGTTVADDEEYCIPDDATFGFSVGPGVGFIGGTLEGTVTDAMTLAPIPFASIIGTNVGLSAFSAPGSGDFAGLGSAIQGGMANVIRDGYDSQAIAFDLEQMETTPCSVALMPSGMTMDSDLSITDLQVAPTTVVGGEPVVFSTQILNGGAGAAPATTLRFYRSDDATIDPGDTEIGNKAIAGLMASEQLDDTQNVPAPLVGGSFFLGACVDTVEGETNAGNNCSAGIAVTIDHIFANGFETPSAGGGQKGAPSTCTLL
ncbi:MAG: CARDB domain-containing protein [Lysobacterales bacterium]